MAKVTPKRPTGAAPPGQTNMFATKSVAGEKTAGTGGEKGKPNGNGGRGRDGRKRYGTRPGNCNKCKEPGHYSYECMAQESQATASAASGK